ncbi:protoglobin domain-containing protein [Mesobacillus subterraneus]|uniref:protoglobin domain-containing protein n=1 Tax=Mesobacillus subterraneus TaxID=285983 RepID=UPI00273DAFCC|nr:protoglobin domain-containing protein [Mesobacillus subterraneus]WLR57379.1 protoglobin domain-containing protein [Mesobacillus subterraneus]
MNFLSSKRKFSIFNEGITDIETNERFKEKLKFLGMTKQNRETVTQLQELYAEYHEEILGSFIVRFKEIPHILEKMGTVDEENIQQAFHVYLISLFEDDLDLYYVFKRRTIAEMHEKLGVTPDWLIPVFHILSQQITIKIAEKWANKPELMIKMITAFQALITIDQQLIIETYMEHTASDFIHGLAEIIEYNANIEEVKELLDYQAQQVQEAQAINAAMEELTDSTEEIASTIGEINSLTIEKLDDLDKGIKHLDAVTYTFKEIDQQQIHVVSSVDELNKKSIEHERSHLLHSRDSRTNQSACIECIHRGRPRR